MLPLDPISILTARSFYPPHFSRIFPLSKPLYPFRQDTLYTLSRSFSSGTSSKPRGEAPLPEVNQRPCRKVPSFIPDSARRSAGEPEREAYNDHWQARISKPTEPSAGEIRLSFLPVREGEPKGKKESRRQQGVTARVADRHICIACGSLPRQRLYCHKDTSPVIQRNRPTKQYNKKAARMRFTSHPGGVLFIRSPAIMTTLLLYQPIAAAANSQAAKSQWQQGR